MSPAPHHRRRLRSGRGQATVELVGLLPLLLAVGFGVVSLLSAAAANEAAGGAAEAGAVALLQERDPEAAARSALGDWPRDRASVRIRDRRITVRLTPAGPLGRRLAATASAAAGRAPGAAPTAPAASSPAPAAPPPAPAASSPARRGGR